MDNVEIARRLAAVADLLEIQGANAFRIRAYRNAVRTIQEQTEPLARMLEAGRELTALPGIGKEMARHVAEMVETGELALLEKLSAEVPPTLLEVMRLPGVGPKKARRLFDELEVATVAELEAAARSGAVAALRGFGDKSQQKILAGIADAKERGARILLSEADRLVVPLVTYLAAQEGVERLEVAGSYRRRLETVGDVDLLAAATDPGPVNAAFVGLPQVERVERAGDTRSTVVLGSGLKVDLRVVAPESWGSALVYFTGSKEHNVKLRMRALERGLKVSEYGVFRHAGGNGDGGEGDDDGSEGDDLRTGIDAGERIAGASEQEVYAALDLEWVPPELREDRGELAAAARSELPQLVTAEALRGDLHMHSTWSDGRSSLEEMVAACAERGYEYMAITDHSAALAMTNGLDARRLALQAREIERVQQEHPEIRILRGQEVDILRDGSLDQDDEALAALDLVLISVHSYFDLPPAEQTERMLRAVAHPAVHVIGHPTGRKLNRRKPLDFDLDAVLEAAAEHRVAVEINSSPRRLDLKDTHLMRARQLGVKVVIATDAHRAGTLDTIRYGVEQARRAWLEPGDVLNTLPLPELLAALAKD